MKYYKKKIIKEVNKYISARAIKNKINIKIFISNNKIVFDYICTFNNFVYYFEKDKFVLPFWEIITKKFDDANNLFFDEFDKNNKKYYDGVQKDKEILSQNSIKFWKN